MDTITLSPIGEIALKKPKMSIVYDIVSTWTAQPSQAHIGRLAAAALGVCADPTIGLSAYDTDQARPIAYGGLIMDELLSRKVRPHDIIDNGMKILTFLAPLLLSDDEVKKK
jgi:hypothetical protein